MKIKREDNSILILKPKKIKDERGFFMEIFKADLFPKINFIQENVSKSKYGVIRGLHFQKPPYEQSKLVRVVNGEILDVVVDLRKDSKNYGKSFCYYLSGKNYNQIYIPPYFAHGFVCLSEYATISYKVDKPYKRDYEWGINSNDPFLGIDWKVPLDDQIRSLRDKNLPLFNEINSLDF
jgi:dTDP-4-dehydrorhamnose 3,5-epimerase